MSCEAGGGPSRALKLILPNKIHEHPRESPGFRDEKQGQTGSFGSPFGLLVDQHPSRTLERIRSLHHLRAQDLW